MKAIRIQDFGGPEMLRLEEVPIPQPQDDEVLIRVWAASVNPVDYKTRQGTFRAVRRDDLPLILGRDCSGTIESCGSRVEGLRAGDAVFALLGRRRGAYAQYAVAKQVEFAPKPGSLSHADAAAVPLAALTAWQGLIDHGGLASSQRVLIHGGAGGVGHLAIQIAKAHGAFVATTVSATDKDFVLSLGADLAIDYKRERFEEMLSGMDLVFDLVAGSTQDRSFAVLKKGGALISTLAKADAAKAGRPDVRTAHYMAESNAAQLAAIGRLVEAGKIKPSIAATFPLEDAAKAQEMLEQGHVRGKIVLNVG